MSQIDEYLAGIPKVGSTPVVPTVETRKQKNGMREKTNFRSKVSGCLETGPTHQAMGALIQAEWLFSLAIFEK
jgi:hypothetical protein